MIIDPCLPVLYPSHTPDPSFFCFAGGTAHVKSVELAEAKRELGLKKAELQQASRQAPCHAMLCRACPDVM